MRKTLGVVPAVFGSVVWLSTLVLLLTWDNYPEEYALPLQFASLYLFCEAEGVESWWRWQGRRREGSERPETISTSSWFSGRVALMRLIIGALMASCFLLKPTLVSTQLTIVLLLIHRRVASAGGRLVYALSCSLAPVCVGALLVLAPVSVYLWVHGVLGEALDAVFRYGLLYSAAPVGDRLLSLLSGLGVCLPSPAPLPWR